ncbi:MAG: DUF4419 domain-containing protein [Planctomycetales bacterium]|nr:DUF4419 domain-containing protein [Planctomycetales bacterium]
MKFLQPFGLDLWLQSLRTICDQFIRAASGAVELEHWRRIYKIRAAYGTDIVNGWLAKLFLTFATFNSAVSDAPIIFLSLGPRKKLSRSR